MRLRDRIEFSLLGYALRPAYPDRQQTPCRRGDEGPWCQLKHPCRDRWTRANSAFDVKRASDLRARSLAHQRGLDIRPHQALVHRVRSDCGTQVVAIAVAIGISAKSWVAFG